MNSMKYMDTMQWSLWHKNISTGYEKQIKTIDLSVSVPLPICFKCITYQRIYGLLIVLSQGFEADNGATCGAMV
jgi:hypothetical protein